MGESKPRPELEVIENGLEPRFFINACASYELMPDGMVMLTYGIQHGGKINVQFSVMLSVNALAELAKHAQHLAAEAHNELVFRGDIGRAN